MRTTLLALAAAGAFALTGCGGDDSDSDGGDESGFGDLTACSEVWVEGETLPGDYEGCLDADVEVALVTIECEDGSAFTSYEDTYYAVLGGDIGKAAQDGGTADDPGYREAYSACTT